MYTSDQATGRDDSASVTGAYLLATVCCALFGAVYELFSHGVYSYWMLYAFAFPLLLGVLPFFWMGKAGKPFPRGIAADCIHSGVAACTAGSIVQGVLEIYGTTNPLTSGFWIAGSVLFAAGWLGYVLFQRARSNEGD